MPQPSDPLADTPTTGLPEDGLAWSEDGEPRSLRFGDVYFSKDDGLAESRAVFLAGCGLPEQWQGRDRFTVAELGFGTGLNIVALLDLWRRERPSGARLHVFTIEAYPLTRDEAARALSAWPEVAEVAQALLAVWPEGTPGFHRLDLPQFNAVIDLAVGEVEGALSQWSGQADAWFLDGFSPALNPEMWSPGVLNGIAARSATDARVATFTVAGFVRRGLEERGFAVERMPGHGRKRQRLEARRIGDPAPVPARPQRVAVVGGGVAGASTARALIAAGVDTAVIEMDQPGAGASGFPAALVTPRLDAGDTTIAALHAQALERASSLYDRTPGAVIAHGVLQLEQAPRDAVRFAKVAAQTIWAPGAMTVLDATAASERLGEACDSGGLAMAEALVLRPQAVVGPWLDGATLCVGQVASLERADDGWRLLDANGQVLAQADAVVLTGGWGNAALLPDLNLAPVRGQADWVETTSGMTPTAVAWGGYVAPTGPGFLFGATHDRGDVATEVREADGARNRTQLAARLPHLAEASSSAPSSARAAVRATTRDRLPVCGPVPDQPGVFILSGLGSRGFCVAPLLSEHLAAVITDAPSPLPDAMEHRLSPARFAKTETLQPAGEG